MDATEVFWQESRPQGAGRYVIVRRTKDGMTQDVNPDPFNARTRAHEYGGGAYIVIAGALYFSNFSDQRLYRQERGGVPKAMSPALDFRYADFAHDRTRNRLLAIREDHRKSDRDASSAIVAIDLNGGNKSDGGAVLVQGYDFYSNPRLSPDGKHFAWLCWNHPNMPWDGTELWTADFLPDGTVSDMRLVAGADDVSIFQPEWSPDGVLTFVSDHSGWWNLYQERDGVTVGLHPTEAEFAVPQWEFGMRTYGFINEDRVICTYTSKGIWCIGDLNVTSGAMVTMPAPFTDISQITIGDGFVVFKAGSPSMPVTVFRLDLSDESMVCLKPSSEIAIDPAYISIPQQIEFPTTGDRTAHGFYYPARNPDFTGPTNERPPLVVISHGGPTSATETARDLQYQYWTSRGFALLDVNYGGSTGYGRAYRERLNGNWGVTDVDDCVNGARYLVDAGHVDGNRLVIRGWSAGGYTTLAALAFRDVFKAGASHFGIGDLVAMVHNSHKFESRYMERLIGPYLSHKDLYFERSPVNFVDQISCPLVLFQGVEDEVVPPAQAQAMYDAVKARGLPVALVMFKGEQHGFRQAENIRRSLDGELYFLSKVFNFTPSEAIEPLLIANVLPVMPHR